MKIAIVGCGFTGLSLAFRLSKLGHKVIVFEKDSYPGGLAIGFKNPKWDWTLEKHYHHWFTNDNSSLRLAKEINYKIITKRPKTSVYVDDNMYQLDSPKHVLTFPKLSIFDRLRMAMVIALIRYNPFWRLLEGIKAAGFLKAFMGKNAYEKIWEPQFKNKFGQFTEDISLAWFWTRLVKRTPSLSYPKGGFLDFANALVKKIEGFGGKVLFNTEVKEIKSEGNKILIKFQAEKFNKISSFDKVIVTLPSFFFLKIAPQLPKDYKEKLEKFRGLGAINIVLRLKEQFLKDGTYWLSICEKNSPFVAIVEHTNFMDKKHYNFEHIVYLGKYLHLTHPYMALDKNELLKIYDPFLKKINPNYKKSIIESHIFKVPFAQPIIPINYSKIMPPFETPIKNMYLANIQQVYPWDRGTNYAIEIGEKVAKLIVKEG